jgi:hypothetical protein
MIKSILIFTLLGVGYAVFAATFRPKKCAGNCGGCALGACERLETEPAAEGQTSGSARHAEGDHHA